MLMKIHLWLPLLAVFILAPACERRADTPREELKEKVDDALDRRPNEEVKDAVEDARDAVKDAAEDVKDAVKDATN